MPTSPPPPALFEPPLPLIDRLRIMTFFRSLATAPVSLITIAVTVVDRIEPKPEPVVPSIVKPLLMVTAPKPPGSRQSISPLTAVFETAPAKVLQGAVRLHGLTSSPTPDTHVRVACACAAVAKARVKARNANALRVKRVIFMVKSPYMVWEA